MRNTAFFLAGLLLLLIQSNLFRVTGLVMRAVGRVVGSSHDLSVPGLVPSLVLPLILFMGVSEYSLLRGAAVVFALGYLTDLIGIAPIGLYTSTYVALFVLARAAGVRLVAQTSWMQMLLVFVFALLHSVVVLVLLAIFGRDAWVPRALYPMALPHALATALVSPLTFRLARRLHAATSGASLRDAPRERA